MRAAIRFGLLVFVGVLLVQTAWMLAVPPFRGADEVDHAYRAAGVASGQWRLTEQAAEGRGHEVVVPLKLATAASAQCSSLPHTGRDNCRAFDVEGERGRVATGAGPYPPAYYWVLGSVGKPFDGSASLYAMRVTSALMCAAGLAIAAALLAFSGGVWTRFSFLTSLTPVFFYSTVVAAPNGPEMVAGACLWAGLLAFGGDRRSRRVELLSVGVITVAAVLLANLRMLGPVLVLLIVAVAATYIGPVQLWWRCLEYRVASMAAVVVAFLGGLTAAAWTLSSDGLAPTNHGGGVVGGTGFASSEAFLKVPLWLFQIVGAFPYPNQPGPTAIYPLVLVVVIALLVLASRRTRLRARVAVVTALAVVLVGPVIITLLTMQSQGVIWQGRYGLPFIVGILPMVGLALDRSSETVHGRRLIPLAFLLLGLAQVLSVTHVLRAELGRRVSISDGSWVHAPVWAVGMIAVAGWMVLSAGGMGRMKLGSDD